MRCGRVIELDAARGRIRDKGKDRRIDEAREDAPRMRNQRRHSEEAKTKRSERSGASNRDTLTRRQVALSRTKSASSQAGTSARADTAPQYQ
jgi:hypothetical protein